MLNSHQRQHYVLFIYVYNCFNDNSSKLFFITKVHKGMSERINIDAYKAHISVDIF